MARMDYLECVIHCFARSDLTVQLSNVEIVGVLYFCSVTHVCLGRCCKAGQALVSPGEIPIRECACGGTECFSGYELVDFAEGFEGCRSSGIGTSS